MHAESTAGKFPSLGNPRSPHPTGILETRLHHKPHLARRDVPSAAKNENFDRIRSFSINWTVFLSSPDGSRHSLFWGKAGASWEDQQQHIEFARRLAVAANKMIGKELFLEPSAIMTNSCKIMSLSNSREKMSKSSNNPNSAIFLLDSERVIEQKIKKASTDSIGRIVNDFDRQPEITNLLRIYEAFSGISIENIVEKFKNCTSYVEFKSELSRCICNYLQPIQYRYFSVKGDATVEKIMAENECRLEGIAREILKQM